MNSFDPATWLRDFRAVGGDVTVRAGSMWIETADVAMPLERFTSVVIGHPERRDAIKAIVMERQCEPADAS